MRTWNSTRIKDSCLSCDFMVWNAIKYECVVA